MSSPSAAEAIGEGNGRIREWISLVQSGGTSCVLCASFPLALFHRSYFGESVLRISGHNNITEIRHHRLLRKHHQLSWHFILTSLLCLSYLLPVRCDCSENTHHWPVQLLFTSLPLLSGHSNLTNNCDHLYCSHHYCWHYLIGKFIKMVSVLSVCNNII